MNKHLLITRAEKQAREFEKLCIERGINPVLCPLIEVNSLHLSNIDEGFASLEDGKFTLIVFTSVNSVSLDVLSRYPNPKIAAVGKKTAKKILDLGYAVDLISSEANEISLGAEVLARYPCSEYQIELFQGNTSSSYLLDMFSRGGFLVRKAIVYEVKPSIYPKDEFLQFVELSFKTPNQYYFSILSAYTAEVFFKEAKALLSDVDYSSLIQNGYFVLIGEKTRQVLLDEGVQNMQVVKEKSVTSVIEAVSKW